MKTLFLLSLLSATALVSCEGTAEEADSSDAEQEPAAPTSDPLERAMTSFLEEHPELGDLRSMEPEKDWRRGQRRQVELSTGRYLVYFFEGRVVTVQRHLPDGGREDVHREELPGIPPPAQEGAREASVEVPEYEILNSFELLTGDVIGEVLIASFSRETPAQTRANVAAAIAKREKLDEVTLYCSRDAQRANMSASFAEEHPDALGTCYLGSWEDGEFQPGEENFP